MLGWCMILMAAAIYLPTKAIGAIGIAIVALHNLTDVFGLEQAFGSSGPNWFLKLLYFGSGSTIGSVPKLLILYVIVPWIGVMMAGYAFGHVMEMPSARRIILRLGLVLTALVFVLRAL